MGLSQIPTMDFSPPQGRASGNANTSGQRYPVFLRSPGTFTQRRSALVSDDAGSPIREDHLVLTGTGASSIQTKSASDLEQDEIQFPREDGVASARHVQPQV
jgi:hypothetical protein